MKFLIPVVVIVRAAQFVASAPLVAQAEPQKVSDLTTANGQAERINMLNDTDFVFDFFNPIAGSISSTGPDGHITSAKLDTFPVLVGEGISMSVGFLGPCGLNTPHIHPRATEFNFAVNGTLRTGMIQENGVRVVTNNVLPGQATVFPRGAIHFEQNLGCEPMLFIAAFSTEDPGTTSIANSFFRLPSDIVEATMGANDLTKQVEQVQIGIPDSVAFGVQQCLQKCGINRTSSSPQTAATSRASGLPRHDVLAVMSLTALLSAAITGVL